MTHDFLVFMGLAVLLVLTPGPDTMLVVRNALRAGARGGVATTFGCVSGLLVHVLCSGLGVSAMLVHSATAFDMVRLAGAAYLVWLGARALHGAWRGAPDARAVNAGKLPGESAGESACEFVDDAAAGLRGSATGAGRAVRPMQADGRDNGRPDGRKAHWSGFRTAHGRALRRAWSEGFLSNVLNPKVAVFYLAVLPNVVASGGLAAGEGALGGAFVRACLFGGMQAVAAVVWFSFLAVSVQRARASLMRPGVQRALEGGVGALMVVFGLRLALERG